MHTNVAWRLSSSFTNKYFQIIYQYFLKNNNHENQVCLKEIIALRDNKSSYVMEKHFSIGNKMFFDGLNIYWYIKELELELEPKRSVRPYFLFCNKRSVNGKFYDSQIDIYDMKLVRCTIQYSSYNYYD